MDIIFSDIELANASFHLPYWQIKRGEHWAIFETQDKVGTIIADLLCGELIPSHGSVEIGQQRIEQVSLLSLQRLLDIEDANDDTDFLDQIDFGSTVHTLVYQHATNDRVAEQLLQDLNLLHLRERGIKQLSTGETRRLMIAIALSKSPSLLVLHDPFSGLDVQHRKLLSQYLFSLSMHVQMIIITSRQDEVPSWIDHIALFDAGTLTQQLSYQEWQSHPVLAQLKAQSAKQSLDWLDLIRRHKQQHQFSDPLVSISNGKVEYVDGKIFTGVNWQIKRGEHWQIRGPNGCGKSTLLGLIFGDHPQCYSNDIQIYGMQRGSGETVWDIKKHTGMVSSALHAQYKVNCSALEVVLSGFYDSIGLYNKPSKQQIQVAQEWLTILHLQHVAQQGFRSFAYSQQRLLLIARAIIKQPCLLIVDEPYQGLDFLGRQLVMNTLDMIARENLSQLLYVSHHNEDTLPSVNHFADFEYNQEQGCYSLCIHHK